MHSLLRSRAIAAMLLLAACNRHVTTAPSAQAAPDQQLVLVSLDGFRWDYFSRPAAVNLRRLAAEGVHATSMVPAFPSVTFPNHYTIVTGLYPEHHGIVANTMYDEKLGWFHLWDTTAVRNAAWWGGEPLWVTAEKYGERAGVVFWPGSEAAIKGVRPSRYMRFDDKFPNAERIDSALTWLTLPGPDRMRVVLVYFSDVDHAGHDFGPDSPQVDSAIARVDTMIGRLMDGVASRGLSDRVNIVVVADHGMAAISRDRVIFLDDYVKLSDIEIIDASAFGLIAPKPGKLDQVYAKLRAASPHLHVYRKSEVPARFHYRHNPRITPLVLLADPGWEITTHARAAVKRFGGDHGYDNRAPDMGALFVAAGPAFNVGVTVPPFQNIHLYDMFCRILGIRPASNDGSPDSTRAMLR